MYTYPDLKEEKTGCTFCRTLTRIGMRFTVPPSFWPSWRLPSGAQNTETAPLDYPVEKSGYGEKQTENTNEML